MSTTNEDVVGFYWMENGQLAEFLRSWKRGDCFAGPLAGANLAMMRTIADYIDEVRTAAPAAPERPELRPQVLAFAVAMEQKLRAHDDKRGERGWHGCGTDEMLGKLEDEVGELSEAVAAMAMERAYLEAVDVANFAMMVADESGYLRAAPVAPAGRQDTAAGERDADADLSLVRGFILARTADGGIQRGVVLRALDRFIAARLRSVAPAAKACEQCGTAGAYSIHSICEYCWKGAASVLPAAEPPGEVRKHLDAYHAECAKDLEDK